ncbi:hypothetical protein FACHB389_22045 [Nostoc calcicola FACHB-389]|nr:hypothetical protein FACHB389_22045 [Nostoc calcicola FACHB-389]
MKNRTLLSSLLRSSVVVIGMLAGMLSSTTPTMAEISDKPIQNPILISSGASLRDLHSDCTGDSRSAECVSAIHRACNLRSAGAGIAQELGNGVFGVACFDPKWYGEISLSELSGHHSGCSSMGNSQSAECVSAIHRACNLRSAGAGIAQELGNGVFGVACFDPKWYGEISIQSESSVRFPIKLNSGQKTIGSHWYMETDVTVSNNGRIDGVTKTKSCQRQGFTGGVWIALIDKESAQDANILHITPVQHYGINGKDPFGGCKDRTDPWSDTFPADISDRIRGIVIYQHHTPKDIVTKEDVYEAIRLGVEIYKASQTGQ